MKENSSHFFDDDGTEINPDLVVKPSLCVSCKKDDDSEEILCTLTRADQQDEEEFICHAYEPKF
ncbi:MAG: hypothetical protein ACE5KZ_16385 [Candidatus Scalinduaceae bacterium]